LLRGRRNGIRSLLGSFGSGGSFLDRANRCRIFTPPSSSSSAQCRYIARYFWNASGGDKSSGAAGLNDGHFAHCLHVDRPSGRQAQCKTLHLIVSALWPQGFDLQMKHKRGGTLSADDHRLKVMFAAADNNRLSRREWMRELGKRGAKARMLKLGKREQKKIARTASKVAAIKRSKRAAAQAQTQSEAVT
jgi:hypothetical protein